MHLILGSNFTASAQQLYKTKLLLKFCAPTSSTKTSSQQMKQCLENTINLMWNIGKQQNFNITCWSLSFYTTDISSRVCYVLTHQKIIQHPDDTVLHTSAFLLICLNTHISTTLFDSFPFQPMRDKTNLHKLYGHMCRIKISPPGGESCGLLYFTKNCL